MQDKVSDARRQEQSAAALLGTADKKLNEVKRNTKSTTPLLPMITGDAAKRTHGYHRHGTSILLAA